MNFSDSGGGGKKIFFCMKQQNKNRENDKGSKIVVLGNNEKYGCCDKYSYMMKYTYNHYVSRTACCCNTINKNIITMFV